MVKISKVSKEIKKGEIKSRDNSEIWHDIYLSFFTIFLWIGIITFIFYLNKIYINKPYISKEDTFIFILSLLTTVIALYGYFSVLKVSRKERKTKVKIIKKKEKRTNSGFIFTLFFWIGVTLSVFNLYRF